MDTTSLIIDSCQNYAAQHATVAKSCCDSASSSSDIVWVTLIICLTVLLMGLIIEWWIYTYKKKSQVSESSTTQTISSTPPTAEEIRKNENHKTRKAYQDRLLSFMERQAITTEIITQNGKTKECRIRSLDEEKANAYINELKTIIDSLKSET